MKKRILKIVKRVTMLLLFLILFILFLLQLSPVQNLIKNQALTLVNQQLEVPLSIDKIKVSFFDDIKIKKALWGIPNKDTLVYIKELSIDIQLMDLFYHKIHIEDVFLDGLKAYILKSSTDGLLNVTHAVHIKTDTSKVDTTKTSGTMEIALDRLVLTNMYMIYHNEVDSSKISTQLKKFDLRMNDFNIQKNSYSINSLKIDGLSFTRNLYKTKSPDKIDLSAQKIKLQHFNIAKTDVSVQTSGVKEDKKQESKFFSFKDVGWDIVLQQFNLNQGSFYHYGSAPKDKPLAEPMNIDSLQLQIKDLILDSTHLEARLPGLMMRYNKKILLQHLSTSLWIDERKALLNQLKFETPKSVAKLDASVKYDSFLQLSEAINKVELNLKLDSRLNSSDIFKVIQEPIQLKKDAEFNLQTHVSGNLSKLKLNKLKGNLKDALLFDITGEVTSLQNIDKLEGGVLVKTLQLNTNKLLSFVPDSLIPNSIAFPDTIQVKGKLLGNKDVLSSDFHIKSSAGNMDAILKLNMDSIDGKEFYFADFNVADLNLGYLLQKEDTLQMITMDGFIEGASSRFKDPSLNMNLNLNSLGLLNYRYTNILVKGRYSDKYFNGNVEANDENLAFKFGGELNLKDSIPSVRAKLNINQANLRALNIMSDSTSLRGNIYVSASGAKWNNLKGKVALNQIQYHTSELKFAMDSVKLNLHQMTDSSFYSLRLHQIYSQDTLLLKEVDLDAQLQGTKAILNYEIASENKDKLKTKKVLVKGDGMFQLQNDTMLLNTDLRWYQNILHTPLKLNIDVSQVKNENMNIFNIKASGDQINISGYAKLNSNADTNNIAASVNIDSLDFSLVEPLTHQYLNKLEGHLSGKVDIVGNRNQPDINGFIIFENTTFNPTATNTDFSIDDGKIKVSNNLIKFDHIKIQDEEKNEAFIDGTINFKELSNPEFDIKMNAEQFLLLNKPESSQGNYYGKVIADLNAIVTGNTLQPNIILTSAFNKKSNFTYVVTSSEPKAATQDDVVVFIKDSTTLALEDTTSIDLMAVDMKGMKATTNISITDKMDVTLVTDPASNEKLNIVGSGDLSLSIDPSGNQTLTGQYNIKKGSYTLRLYDVIKRDFSIKEGSSLSWYGDVMNADANISAIYKVRTSALSLMSLTQGQLSESETSSYNTTINVEVVMNLSGNLLSPDIDFDIVLADNKVNSNIEAAISQLSNDESELNKQVFSLLILNRFSGNKASATTAVTYEIENTARQSLSKLLAQQLNRFSNQYLKGVDVSFDIDSYNQVVENQTSTRTDVSVDVSQNLFNDRLKLTVGGNVAVEENKQKSSSSSSDLTGDFELEYKISKDGTYRLKAFNKTEYEDELNGDVTKTGLSFMFIKDFTRFSDLFKKHKKKKSDAVVNKE